MRLDNLPQSNQFGSMIQMPAPCGWHVIYYPALLAQMVLQQKKYHVFHTTCECGRAYIIATQDDGAHLRIEDSPFGVVDRYESIPWEEFCYVDSNGIFFYKQAPSLEGLKACFADRSR